MTLDEYEQCGQALYGALAVAVAAILHAAISERTDLWLQNIQRRAKDVASLRGKLVRADAAGENNIGDIAKDIAGCRLIFYTNGDVYRFGQSGIIRENFEIDFARSKIHYPKNTDDGAEFFISENWVVKLSEARCSLPEYRRFAGLRCEIQVQTILDHSWAEMAHDTIYKPMTDVGFGAAAVEGMRGRLRKVMRDYLQPAGYEFDKIASDFARLREGKSMFDEDALETIRACQDRNSLHDAIERFSAHVLPHYDDLRAWAPAIIDSLSDAAVRAVSMPDLPQQTYFGEMAGTKIEAVLAQICRVLQSGYLLYVDPVRMFDAIVTMRAATRTAEQCKPVDDLARRFARHDLRAWKQAGSGLQRMIVDRVASLDNNELTNAAPVITPMLSEALSSSVQGETWSAEAVTIHNGAVQVSEELVAMRRDALGQLKRLHASLQEGLQRESVRHAMAAAGNTPNNSGYSDALGVVIMDDLTEIVEFFATLVPELPLEPKRRIEVELFRIYFRYHSLPPALAQVELLVAAQARLLAAIATCRTALDTDEDLARYRLLVGFDNISALMWEKVTYDYECTAAERSAGIDGLVGTVTEATKEQWLGNLERYVETRSNDLAMFLGLQEFIGKCAAVAPTVVIGWLPRLSGRLAEFLPGMLHNLADTCEAEAVGALIERWVADGQYLPQIAWYLHAAKNFRFDLLLSITDQAIAAGDDHVLGNVAVAAARQSGAHPEGIFGQVFLPAARSLASRNDYCWVGGIFNWKDVGLLRDLSVEQVEELLALLVGMPRLGMRGDEMLAIIAERFPDKVLGFVGARFANDRGSSDTRYEDLPYDLYYLKPALAAVPDRVVAAAREWHDVEPNLSEFRGGRLIADLFPNFEPPLQQLLQTHVVTDRDGIIFVLSVLRAYQGQAFLHPLLQEIVDRLDAGDDLLTIVRIVIDSTGVLMGEYGSVEAHEIRMRIVAVWANDSRVKVQEFGARYLKSAKNSLAWERRHADANIAMRKVEWDE